MKLLDQDFAFVRSETAFPVEADGRSVGRHPDVTHPVGPHPLHHGGDQRPPDPLSAVTGTGAHLHEEQFGPWAVSTTALHAAM